MGVDIFELFLKFWPKSGRRALEVLDIACYPIAFGNDLGICEAGFRAMWNGVCLSQWWSSVPECPGGSSPGDRHWDCMVCGHLHGLYLWAVKAIQSKYNLRTFSQQM